jgi:uncharacterized repeat protein (TIGR01451 family)
MKNKYFNNKLKNDAGEYKNKKITLITIIISLIMIISSISSMATVIDSNESYVYHNINSTFLTSIWTTDAYGNPKNDFSPGDLVYVHGIGFIENHNVDVSIIRPDSSVDTGSVISNSEGGFVYIYDLNGILGLYIVIADDGINSAQTTFTDGNPDVECQQSGFDGGIVKFQCGSTTPNEYGSCSGYLINVVWTGCSRVDWTSNLPVCGVIEKAGNNPRVIHPGGLSGTILKTYQQDISHITFCCCEEEQYGCLEITKIVDWGSSIDTSKTFTVTVTGSSYPTGISHTFGYNGGTWALSDLIPGSYTIVETDPGVEWVVTPGLSQTVTVNPGTNCATVSITNTLNTGCLEITKIADWGEVTPNTGQTFTVTVTGPSYPSGISNTFSYNGGTWTLNDLMPGLYTIVETNPGSNWVISPGLSQTVAVNPSTPCATVSITNTFITGCLEITKIVDWLGSISDTGQTFTITVTGPSYPSGISYVFDSSGGTWTLNDLTPGSYSVVETDPGLNWDVSPGLSQTVTVDSGTPCTSVSITNTLYAGCLEINKYVDWSGSTPNSGQTFTITVTGPSHPMGISHIFGSSGGWWTLYDLIPGTYTVTEADPGSPWVVSPGLTQIVTVEPGSLMCDYVSISNFYYAGCLEITKYVEWWSVTPDPGQTFTVTVTGPSHPMGISHVFGSSGGTWTLYDLTPGSYTVTETDPGPNWIVTPSLTQTVSVSVGTPCASVSITNIFDAGCLDIEKHVEWGSVTPDSGKTFTVTVTGPSHPTGITYVFDYLGGMWTLYDLIPGVYTVVESDPGASWVVTPGLSQTVTVNPGLMCAYVPITNTISVGCLEITKEVSWGCVPPDTGQSFTVTVTGPSYPNPGTSHTFSSAGGTWTLNDVIPGSYTITETDPGSDWDVNPGLSQTITVNPGTPCTSVLFNNTIDLGCLDISVSVDWGSITPDPGQTFTVTVTGPSKSTYSHVFGHLGGSWVINGLLPGDYTVVQTDPGPIWIVTGGTQTITIDSSCWTAVSIHNEIDLGCLEVTKIVEFGNTVYSGSITETFEICITGPSYPSGDCQIISESGGTLTWSNLIPGTYAITETNPGPEWIVTGDTSVIVNPGTPCATATITNTYDPGCLEITKIVNWNGATTYPILFEICITGPSYPSGDCQIISELGGTLTWFNLIPGTYTITETDPGPEWIVTGDTSVVVNPGTPCATAYIINDHLTPSVEILKEVWDDDTQQWVRDIRVPNGTDLLFRITVSNTGNMILTDITITDTMSSQLEYRNQANIPPVSSSLHQVTWHIDNIQPGGNIIITFHAESVHTCHGWNEVEVITLEGAYDYDMIPVKVILGGQPVIDITMKVWDAGTSSWVNNIQRGIGSNLLFKIKVNNTANSILHDIIIEADLPSQLTYDGNSNYPPTSHSSNYVLWSISQLTPGEVIEITYDVLATNYGVGNSDATVNTFETFYDQDSVLVTIINYPTIQLNYPSGGENLEEITEIEWFAIDSSDPNLDIYLYYSNNDGISWRALFANSPAIPIENTGNHEWDTTDMSDGDYKLKIEAVNKYNAVSHDTSDSFTINNGITYTKVSDIYITDTTMNTNNLVKNGDTVEISAGITNGQDLSENDITANLTGFGVSNIVNADNYDGFTAIWTIENVECLPSNGVIIITVTADNIDSKSATIIADNKAPDIYITKPINGLYINNNRIIPLFRTLIIGQITVELKSENILYDLDKTEYYIDNELKFTDTEQLFKWDINFIIFGRHKLEIICYDKIGNQASITQMITIYNFFRN